MEFDHHVFPVNKKDYIKGKKPSVDCILCAVVDKKKDVECLNILETDLIICSVNLYPYNNGHILLFPKRHIVDIRELTKEENIHMNAALKFMLDIIDDVYKPTGYNIGFNIGKFSGASIDHIHQHIIPRFPNELGVIDLIGGAKVLLENPVDTCNILKEKIQKEFENFKTILKSNY